MRTGKRLGLVARSAMVAAGIVFACTAALVIVPKLDLNDTVRDSINHELGRFAGSGIMLNDASEVSVRPDLRVVVVDPIFTTNQGGEAEGFLTSASLDASLSVAPLFMGRGEIASIHLQSPHISLDQVGLANAMWPDITTSDENTSENRKPPATIVVTDGVLDFGGQSSIFGLNLSVAQGDASRGVLIDGNFIAGAHRTFFDMEIDDPLALFSEGGSEATLSLSFDALTADDDVSSLDNPTENSSVEGLVNGLRDLNLFGPGPLVVDGHFAMTSDALHVSDATFSKGGIGLEGDLALRTTFDTLIIPELQTLLVSANAAISDAIDKISTGNWAATPLKTNWLNGFDVDLDLEGEDISLGGATLDTVSVLLRSVDRNLSLEVIARSGVLGRIEARANIDRSAHVLMSARISEASIADIVHPISQKTQKRLIGTPQLPEGTLNADLHLTGRGQTLGEFFENLEGSVMASMEDGSLTGADVTATLETLANGRQFMTKEKGPLIPAAGRTHFDIIDGQVGIEAGTAHISRLNIAGDRLEIDMLGEVGLKSGAVYVTGNAQLSAAQPMETAQVARHVDLPFGIGGTLFSPLVAAGVPRLEIAAAPTQPINTIQR